MKKGSVGKLAWVENCEHLSKVATQACMLSTMLTGVYGHILVVS